MRQRFQIPLYKPFFVTAVYAVALGVSSRLGGGWQLHGVALMLGTALSALALTTNASNFYAMMEIGFGMCVGTFCSVRELVPTLAMFTLDPQDDCPSNVVTRNAWLIAAMIGMVGGAGAAILLQRIRNSHAVVADDSPPSE